MIASLADKYLDCATVRSIAAASAGDANMEQLHALWHKIREEEPRTATWQETTSGCLILVGNHPEWWAVGAIYAALTGRTFRHESETKHGPIADPFSHLDSTLLMMGPREEFQYGRIQEIFAGLQPIAEQPQGYLEEQSGRFALLTAPTLEVMIRMMRDTIRDLLLESHTTPINVLHFLTLEDRELLAQPHPQIRVLNRKTAQVNELLASAHDVLTIMSHGTDEMLYIGAEEAVCGYAGEIEQMRARLLEQPEQDQKNFPVCVYQGHCTRPGDRVRADHIEARIVLLNTCLGLRMGDATFADEFSVGLNFLNGHATHLVAVDQVKEGDAAEGAFFSQLLRAGVSIGEAVKKLNNLMWAADLNAPGYVLIGDPTACLSDRELESYSIKPDADGRFQIELKGEEPILHVRLVGSKSYDACLDRKLSVHIHAPDKRELFTVLLPDRQNHMTDLYLFAFGDLGAGVYDCELVRWDDGLGNRVERALAQYHLLSPRKILPDKIKGAVKEIKAKSIQIARTRKASRLRVADANVVARQIQSFHDHLDRVDAALAQWHYEMMIGQAFQLPTAYFDQWELVQQRTGADRCPISGHRLSERVMRHPLLPSSVLLSSICPKCGEIQDGVDRRIRMYMAGEARFQAGEPIVQELILENLSMETMRGSAALAVWDKGFDLETTPGVTPVELAPGASARVRVVLTYDPARIQAHLHYLRGVFVSDLCVYRAHKNIHIIR